jgi:hypothetical protein
MPTKTGKAILDDAGKAVLDDAGKAILDDTQAYPFGNRLRILKAAFTEEEFRAEFTDEHS